MGRSTVWYEVRFTWGNNQQGYRRAGLTTKKEAISFYNAIKKGMEKGELSLKHPLIEDVMQTLNGFCHKNFPDSVSLVRVEEKDIIEFATNTTKKKGIKNER